MENELRKEHRCLGVGEYDGRFVDASQIPLQRAISEYEKCSGEKLPFIPYGIHNPEKIDKNVKILVFDFEYGTGFKLVSEKN